MPSHRFWPTPKRSLDCAGTAPKAETRKRPATPPGIKSRQTTVAPELSSHRLIMLVHILLLCAAWATWKAAQALRARQRLAKVSGPPSASFLTGNLSQLLDKQGWDFHFQIAEQYGSVVKLNWLFGSSALYVYDPLALQHILKDTARFDEMPWYLESNRLFLGPGVLGVNGHTHRRQRKMLLPVFSAKHLRGLVPVFYRVTHRLTEAISRRVQEGSADIDMLNWMSRTALELIGQSGIGHSFDPLTEDVADAYAEAVKNFTHMRGDDAAPPSNAPCSLSWTSLAPSLVGPEGADTCRTENASYCQHASVGLVKDP
ncbi:hypothetical protein NUW54_g2118 [Trametes sanguinea]|uniref:Uncharacterized protein n=1 Tax=Trametes sanguinea TaxID=158606 RepID=A0ACC1Q695_9APHY|nr:hypothetical protein NUW54_g2118 [Trametes sanguinea]